MTEHDAGPIVVVGAEDDEHVVALRERGADPVVLDALSFPDRPRVSMGAELEDITIEGRQSGNRSHG